MPVHHAAKLLMQDGVMPVHHTLGNHCLSVPRADLKARLHMSEGDYRAVNIAPGWLLIVLDTTDVTPWANTAAPRRVTLGSSPGLKLWSWQIS